jgi:dsRNA-specific ribonuclease
MKRLRLLRWSGTVLSPRTRPKINQAHLLSFSHLQSTTSPSELSTTLRTQNITPRGKEPLAEDRLLQLPSPPVEAVHSSAKLSALHARLSLPPRLPLETLARTLVDASADSSPQFNNKPFSILGNDLLGYYTSEYIVCQYPRLPLAVVYAAMYAYVGEKALAAITREWGVETAAAPGGEVDPGLLQLKMLPPDTAHIQPKTPLVSTAPEANSSGFRRSISSRTVYDDEFGEIRQRPLQKDEDAPSKPDGTTVEKASSNFVRALMGAVYLHGGRLAAKQFYREHFMSRQLAMSDLFNFRFPTRDLSRLCAREGFRSPVARILSETGRKSRHPVFVVGVYSGNDKLGEGAGSSLDEARTRAAVAALKGWYLYSPVDFRVPSETEEEGAEPWSPVLVDSGDIVV